jgi:adrenodoxin-NADP+ reductase
MVPGLYVSGWLKRGPVGVIAATMYDAFETADMMVSDVEQNKMPIQNVSGAHYIERILKERNVQSISFEQWKIIDKVELERGKKLGKSREKILSKQEILSFL